MCHVAKFVCYTFLVARTCVSVYLYARPLICTYLLCSTCLYVCVLGHFTLHIHTHIHICIPTCMYVCVQGAFPHASGPHVLSQSHSTWNRVRARVRCCPISRSLHTNTTQHCNRQVRDTRHVGRFTEYASNNTFYLYIHTITNKQVTTVNCYCPSNEETTDDTTNTLATVRVCL